MQLKPQSLTSFVKLFACAIFAFGFTAWVHAADAGGKWAWAMPGRGGGEPRKTTLTLKVEGEKLTGKVSTPGRDGGDPRETEISNGKVKADEVSFTVTREFGGNTFTQKYSGKVSGDTIKGKIEFERNGETQSRDWEAKREK